MVFTASISVLNFRGNVRVSKKQIYWVVINMCPGAKNCCGQKARKIFVIIFWFQDAEMQANSRQHILTYLSRNFMKCSENLHKKKLPL